MKIELIRYAYLFDRTLARLEVGEDVLWTVAQPWRPSPLGAGGIPYQSCIPDGEYQLLPYDSDTKPNTYLMLAPELCVYATEADLRKAGGIGRYACLIHIGNRPDDVRGCEAIGMAVGEVAGGLGVVRSREAMARLNVLLGRHDAHTLLIRPTHGTVELS